ncbi:hypothetical protein ACFX13_028419 [Malus domestica]
MEVESDQPDNVGNCIEETSVQDLFDPGTPDISNMFGEQQVDPRIGDAYQVEIPSITMDAKQYKLLTNPIRSKAGISKNDSLHIIHPQAGFQLP